MRKRLTTGERNIVAAQLNRDIRATYSTDLIQRTNELRHEGRKELYYSTGVLKSIVDAKLQSQTEPQSAHAQIALAKQAIRGKRKNNGFYRQDAIIASFSYIAFKDERSLNRRAIREAKRAERKERRDMTAFVKGEVLSYLS